MNVTEVRTLIDYHYWARDRMFEAVDRLTAEQYTRDLGNSFRSVRDTVVHIYSAEWIWLSRWQGESPTAMLAAEEFPDVASVRGAWGAHEVKMRTFFETVDRDVDRLIEYKTMDGKPMASVLWQMLQHVINHASYHRGQVTTMVRQLGASPPKSTDLITFYRERGATAV